jgi:phosphoserine phosphatase
LRDLSKELSTFDKTELRGATKVAFDVDLTLIDHEDRPLYDNIVFLRWFVDKGYDVIIWSGGGVSYAEMWARKLGFEGKVRVVAKGSEPVHLAFDDEEFSLADCTVIV